MSRHLDDASTLIPGDSNVLAAMTGISQYPVGSLHTAYQRNAAGTDIFGIGYNDLRHVFPLTVPITTPGLVASADAQSNGALAAEQWLNPSVTPTNLDRLSGYSGWLGAEFPANTDSEWRVAPECPELPQSADSPDPFDFNENLNDFVWPLSYSDEFS